MKKFLLTAVVSTVLSACGDGNPGVEIIQTQNPIKLSTIPAEIIASIDLNATSLYPGSDVLFFNVLGKGDIDSDGYEDLVIGLFRHTKDPSYSGREFDPSGEIKPVVLFYEPNKDTYVVNEQLQSVIRANQHPRQVSIADFDGDGRNDIFIADHGYDDGPYGNQNTLLLNKVTGYSDGTHLLPQYADFSHGLVVADFDNNGKSDLLVMNNEVNSLTKCQYYPGFTGCTHSPLKYSQSYVLFNNGPAGFKQDSLNISDNVINFQPTVTDKSSRLSVGYAADLNHDGWNDLVISDHRNIYIIESDRAFNKFLNAQVIRPPAIFSACTYTPSSSIVSIDLDKDGFDEIVASTTCDLNGAYFRVFKRNSNKVWEDKTDVFVPDQAANSSASNDSWCYKFEVVDLNLDGEKDIICQSVRGFDPSNNNVFWYVINGKILFSNITMQDSAWASFETVVKNKNGSSILGFNFSNVNGKNLLLVKRWKQQI